MRMKLITGVTGDQPAIMANLRTIRVVGTAALVGAVQLKVNGVVQETLAAATAVGVERDYDDVSVTPDLGGFVINMANAADAVLVFYT